MNGGNVPGYGGNVLRVDLNQGKVSAEVLQATALRKWIGGTALGARYLYEEVPPGVAWDAPENRLIVATGPLAGTAIRGTGTFSVVTKGPMTNGATSTQANGFMGAYMKFSGFDGLVVHGQSPRWVYLYLHDGQAELRAADHLVGLDTLELEKRISGELGHSPRSLSVFGIGPAGENRVRYAAIVGDQGHVAAHNGVGAVMGSKRLKAIVAQRGTRFPVADSGRVTQVRDKITATLLANPMTASVDQWGTSQLMAILAQLGGLPVKNYQTNVFEHVLPFLGQSYRQEFSIERTSCWACQTHHLHKMTVKSGPHAGFSGEEPEYEQWASWGPLIGNADVASAFVLSNLVDRLGLDTCESGWVVAWAMEAYEKGVMTREDLNGLDLTWGNTEAVGSLLEAIARREGIGDLLAEGVKRAAEKWGRGSADFAVFTGKGNTPRTNDHRALWGEMFDTSFSSTGTIEVGLLTAPEDVGLPPTHPNVSNPQLVAEILGKSNGRLAFEDSIGVCRLTSGVTLSLLAEAINAATGWDLTVDECLTVGRRADTLLRCFNLRHGIGPETEYPSMRYGSTPRDGAAAGQSVAPHWQDMRRQYYELRGWDLGTGKPLPDTLTALGLEFTLGDLWPQGGEVAR